MDGTRHTKPADARGTTLEAASSRRADPPRTRPSTVDDGVSRLDASENPYGASHAVEGAVAAQLPFVHRYPDATSSELIATLAQHHGVAPEQVAVGNGLDELILVLALTLGGEGRLGIVTDATFRSYAEALAAIKRPFIRCPLVRYRIPVDDVARCLRLGDTFAFVCNPHNPTGTLLRAAELEALSRAADDGGSPLIVDEAYAEFAGESFPTALPLAATTRHVCVLRTFSKAYGLAGLRVGYIVGPPRLVARVREAQRALPYRVNRLAQAAAVAALSDPEFVRRTVRMVVGTREWFAHELQALGLHSIASATNFVLVELGDRSSVIASQLRERGHLVRDTRDMGLPGHVRISIGTRPQMLTLRDSLRALVETNGAAERLRPAPAMPMRKVS
jgi:histidinol-phosphate aminotransferase